MIQHENTKRFLRTHEAAEYIGMSKSFLEQGRSTGLLKIPYAKAGRTVIYDARDLDSWLESRKRNSTSESGEV